MEEYLGDGVYASHDGYQVRLRCASPSESNVIYLEPGVFARLVEFERRIREKSNGQHDDPQ